VIRVLNEGVIVKDTTALIKTAILNQIRRLGPTTPDELERAVFRDLTGHDREEVDWDIEDNQAGYHMWIKSLDRLIAQLVDDGYMLAIEPGKLVPTGAVPNERYSHLVYPKSK
jgi:hypothetical protein